MRGNMQAETKPLRHNGDDPLLTVAECARELGCSDRFIRAEVADGNLQAVKVSTKMIRIRRSWWNRYLEERLTRRTAA